MKKRLLLIFPLLTLLLLSAEPFYGQTLVANTAGGSSDGNGFTIAGSVNTTSANFLAMAVSDDNGVCTPTDTIGGMNNAWTEVLQIAQGGMGGFGTLTIYKVAVPIVGLAHTFGVSCTGNTPAIAVQAWSGITGSSDTPAGALGVGVTSQQGGGVTPSTANNVVLSALGHYSSTAPTIAGYMISDAVSYVTAQHYGVSFAYLVQAAATPANPTWMFSLTDAEVINVDLNAIATAVTGPKSGSLTTLGAGK
jgi:hypothetical protein